MDEVRPPLNIPGFRVLHSANRDRAIRSPRILYLDQNKWIDLAACLDSPGRFPERYAVADRLIKAIRAWEILVPLTFGNIFETVKINDPRRRKIMAEVQSDFSRGIVFRGRAALLQAQLEDSLAAAFSVHVPARAPLWFLSDLFFESVANFASGTLGPKFTGPICDAVRANASRALFAWLMAPSDDVRKDTVRQHSAASQELIARIEARRALTKGTPQGLRRGIYDELLLQGDAQELLQAARSMGLTLAGLDELDAARIQTIVEGVPLYVVERELVVKTEAEERPIHENDLRDLAAFDVVLPYADVVIGEKAFLNRARQARLGERYRTRLLTDFNDLAAELDRLAKPQKKPDSANR